VEIKAEEKRAVMRKKVILVFLIWRSKIENRYKMQWSMLSLHKS